MIPFVALVAHFARRLFASEEEQSSRGMGLGLGATLAMVASPGAFASIFMMNKYSTLLEWLRGVRIDAIRQSPSDEYFFVVLSMTIIGLLMVARWNRLFPDRRDFSNLAILPIPVRHIFLANFVALLGLAVVFGIVTNVVSAGLFPLFVAINVGTWEALRRLIVANGVTVFSASLFSFFAVFALVGLLTLLVPRRIYRPVSLAMRLALIVGLLVEFFSNLFVQLFAGRLPGSAASYIQWIPSFWFVGLYEHILGIATPHMERMGQRAELMLGATIVVAILSYALCYRRIFRRLPESFDMLTGSRAFFRIKFPEALLRPLFRSQWERACSSFACKVLLRSESHLLFFGGYFGIGLVIVAQTALDSLTATGEAGLPPSEYLAIPLLIAFILVSGLRFVFDIPAAYDANWVFRLASGEERPRPEQVARRLMLWATLPWVIGVLPFFLVNRLGWTLAIIHAAVVAMLTVFVADLLLLRFRKIPFTCMTQLDMRQLLWKMLGTIIGVSVIVPSLAAVERWMMQSPGRFAWAPLVVTGGYGCLFRYRRSFSVDEHAVLFADGPGPPFELLKLT